MSARPVRLGALATLLLAGCGGGVSPAPPPRSLLATPPPLEVRPLPCSAQGLECCPPVGFCFAPGDAIQYALCARIVAQAGPDAGQGACAGQ